MFLVSGPRLITETCRCGVAAAFPALNQRSTAGFEQWVVEIKENLVAAERSGSIKVAGLDPDHLAPKKDIDFGSELQPPGEQEAKAWKTVWSAGQGVGSIDDIVPAAELCHRLKAEYLDALERDDRF